MHHVFSRIESVTRGEGEAVYISQVIGQRSNVYVAGETFLQPLGGIVHTKGKVDVERREDVGVDGSVIALIATRKLCVRNEL